MKPYPTPALAAGILAGLFLAPALLDAATMSASPTAPPVNGFDISNFSSNNTDKWWNDNKVSGYTKGQTFTTGTTPVLLRAVTFQTSSVAIATKGYTVRVGTVAGTTFTQIHSETASQNFTWNPGEYMTWTFATPLALSPNTLYGFDVGMRTSTTEWQTGIPYIYRDTGNPYAGGTRFMSGSGGGIGDTTMNNVGGDMVFHLDLQHPLAPSPDDGSQVPAGDLTLSWTNLAPTTGSDVWVDVWFGTDPGNLTKVVDGGLNVTSTIVNLPAASTYYWRVDSYLDGTPTGTPVQSTVFNLIVIDSDSDGFPDAYELLHTTPPSATALNRDDDNDQDGQTNWVEYDERGTSPSKPDTDSDGLLDFSAITVTSDDPRHAAWATLGILFTDDGVQRTFRAEATLGSDPLKPDTDGDGLGDAVETNTGNYISSTNTGTNPTLADTDADGLKDGVETKSGIYVSATNTGTNPLLADSDSDGAGDWYEVVIIDKKPSLGSPPNSPNDATLKPNISYPLPDPDTSTGATDKPVKVYIMSGQSNMVGFGQIAGTGPGTLQTLTGAENKFPNLVASGGGWTTRKDVKYQGVISDVAKGDLKPDVAGDKYGPELGFGYIMGWHHDEPVLLIKASQGNRGLMWDILPPGSPRTVYGATTFPAYGESPETWATATGGPTPFQWYAGKQYDDFFLKEDNMGPLMTWTSGTTYPDGTQLRHNGVHYISKDRPNPIINHVASPDSEPGSGTDWQTYWQVYSVSNTADILDNFATEHPTWAAQGFEIAGYVWWQGYDDTGEPRATRYEPNMVQFIKQIRAYYENRYNNDASTKTKTKVNAPFVLATLAADGGWGNTAAGYAKVAQAQLNVDGSAGIYPEFAGNVKTMEARGFWRDSTISPSGQGYHYNWNAETYLLVGDALGRAMVDLNNIAPPGNTYANWIAGYPAVPPGLAGFDQDADGDGIDNGAENFFGTNPGAGSSGLVGGVSSGNTFTFTHPQNANPATGVTAAYRWSKDLTTFRGHDETDGDNTTVSFNAVTNAGVTTVTATVTGTATAKLFVDVKVTQN
jgi:alpha-galactosidase